MKAKPKVTLSQRFSEGFAFEVSGFASGAGIGLKSVVYHMKLQALPSAGLPLPSIAPRMVFVLRALTASEMRFLSENDVRYAS